MRLAYMVLEKLLAGSKPGLTEGFTPEQRFFLGWAQVWCTNQTDEATNMRATTDPHSPPKYREMGVLSNMPQFRQAFSCSEGSPMANASPNRVW
jgi:predicted metalloendopeptidase